MAKLLKGKPVSDFIINQCATKVSDIITKEGNSPELAVVSVGQDASNESYLKGIQKKSSEAGIVFNSYVLDSDSTFEDLADQIVKLNNNDAVSGILLMRPLPDGLKHYEREICELIDSKKDVDAANSLSVAGAFLGTDAYPPCTAEACMKILDYYDCELEGKHAVVIGRSLVVGKPLANLLLNRNATVTVCHSKSENLAKISKSADIVIVATGTPKKFGAKYFSKGQFVVDAGIN